MGRSRSRSSSRNSKNHSHQPLQIVNSSILANSTNTSNNFSSINNLTCHNTYNISSLTTCSRGIAEGSSSSKLTEDANRNFKRHSIAVSPSETLKGKYEFVQRRERALSHDRIKRDGSCERPRRNTNDSINTSHE